MPRFNLSERAIQDLTEIWNYTYETWSEKQADYYYRILLNSCDELAKSPSKGKKYFEIFPELFGKSVMKHIIFYRLSDKHSIEIIRVLHSQMDLRTKLVE